MEATSSQQASRGLLDPVDDAAAARDLVFAIFMAATNLDREQAGAIQSVAARAMEALDRVIESLEAHLQQEGE